MSETILSALIQSVPITCVAIITALITITYNKKQNIIDIIIKTKIEQMDKIKDNLSEYIGDARACLYNNWEKNNVSKGSPYDMQRYYIHSCVTVANGYKAMMNINTISEKELTPIIESINTRCFHAAIEASEFVDLLNTLTEKTCLLLNNEWDRIKKEVNYKEKKGIFGFFPWLELISNKIKKQKKAS
jgi:hypothetical protein